MGWLKILFGLQSSQETKVYYVYLKVGKYKKFKYMWFSCLDTNMNCVNTNRINNFIYM